MKRGLVVLDPAEVPAGEWRRRTEGLQDRLAAESVDVALVYGDVFASDDIAYLTNLCIYWNEGMLAVPASGDAVFLTKLSPRVHPWMRRISTVERIESGKSFGALVTGLLGDRQPGTVGLVDAPRWPSSIVDEVRAALPGWQVRELANAVGERRDVASQAELALLRTGAGVVGDAARQASAPGLSAFARTAAVERMVRGAGFLDAQTNVAQAPDGVTCVQVTGQYRTGWLHASRLAEVQGHDWADVLREALNAAVGAASAGATGEALAAAAAPSLARLPKGADGRVAYVNQADLASAGEYRRRAASEQLADGWVVAITVDVLFEEGGYAALADTVLVTRGGAQNLTGTREEVAQ